jgi:hypothetical protein
MARRRNRNQSAAQKWTDENIISLLSLLDFTLKHKEVNFETTIVAHLKDVFTLGQIEGKLYRLWNDFGPDQVPGAPKLKSDIKDRGSRSIPKYLTGDVKNEIRLAIEELEKGYGYDALFSTPNRRLRSISRLGTTPSIQDSRLATPARSTPQRQKRKFDNVSTNTFGLKPEIGQVDSSFSKTPKNSSRKKQKTYSKRDVRLLSVFSLSQC